METQNIQKIAEETTLRTQQVEATIKLLDDGATVPFISRYRKEATGGLDEVQVMQIRDRSAQLRELDKRRAAILKSLTEQGKLTDGLKAKVMAAETMAVLEDIYLPYRPKRRTRGTIAREKGLEPLAKELFEQKEFDPLERAAAFVDKEKGVETAHDAIKGAQDIIAEWINEDADIRKALRKLFEEEAVLHSKVLAGKETEAAKYRDYFDWQEPLAKAPSHRILAIRRGADEGFLTFHILPEKEAALSRIERAVLTGSGAASKLVKEAAEDSYKRLLSPSLETELRLLSKKRADEKAVAVFAENLKELLLSPPLGQKNLLAVDPGLRTGCKIVCLDRQGKLLHHTAVYPLQPHKKTSETAEVLVALCKKFAIEAIAIGNGTGGREMLAFCKTIEFERKIPIVSVNESGASVYSASKAAREEFPEKDVTVRGAVSIGRRLMDPLSELVKIEPKSIGVGQYQHDVDQKLLKQSLDDAVINCVNAVGVEVNTASSYLLQYVSGLGPRLAQDITAYRDQNGPFRSRREFLKVSGMGPKTFQQAAGFLRISGGENPLDRSAVHPESYFVVEKMAENARCRVEDLMRDTGLRKKISLEKYVTGRVGMPTLVDILSELEKPGRDPRSEFEQFSFAEHVQKPEDLQPGMRLPGIVTNVTAFGAFVDIGVHQDGLIHISEMADRFVKDPADIVKVNQTVSVTVLSIDMARNRIALSLKKNPELSPSDKPKKRENSARGKSNARSEGNKARANGHKKPSASQQKEGQRKRRPSNNPFVDFFNSQ